MGVSEAEPVIARSYQPVRGELDRRGVAPVVNRRLLTLTWSHLLNDGASNYLPGVLPAVLISLHDPVRMAGGLMAALIAGQALQPAAGWLADRIGGRSLVLSGLFMTSLGGSLLGLAHSTWIVIVLLLLIGSGGALFHPQALSGIRHALAEKQGVITAIFLVGGEIGRGLWPTVASFIVSNFGVESLWIIGLPGLATIPLLRHMAPRLPIESRRRIHWKLHRRPLALLVGYGSARAAVTYALTTFIPIMWHFRGGTIVLGASIITTMITVGVIGNLWGGHLADRIGRRPILIASSIAIAALILPVTYVSGAWLWPLAGLLGIALFFSAAPTILIGQDIFPENRSMGSGIALGFTNGLGALFVLLVGLSVSGRDVSTVFLAAAALSLASVLLALAFPSELMHGDTGQGSAELQESE